MTFLKQATDIDDWMSEAQKRSAQWLEDLLVQSLHLVTLTRYAHNRAGPFRKGFFLSAWDKGQGVTRRNTFTKLASKFMN